MIDGKPGAHRSSRKFLDHIECPAFRAITDAQFENGLRLQSGVLIERLYVKALTSQIKGSPLPTGNAFFANNSAIPKNFCPIAFPPRMTMLPGLV